MPTGLNFSVLEYILYTGRYIHTINTALFVCDQLERLWKHTNTLMAHLTDRMNHLLSFLSPTLIYVDRRIQLQSEIFIPFTPKALIVMWMKDKDNK